MNITLNGQPHPIASETNLTHLLNSLGLSGKPVVAELNQEAVLPRDFPETSLRNGDRLEIITLAAGG